MQYRTNDSDNNKHKRNKTNNTRNNKDSFEVHTFVKKNTAGLTLIIDNGSTQRKKLVFF